MRTKVGGGERKRELECFDVEEEQNDNQGWMDIQTRFKETTMFIAGIDFSFFTSSISGSRNRIWLGLPRIVPSRAPRHVRLEPPCTRFGRLVEVLGRRRHSEERRSMCTIQEPKE